MATFIKIEKKETVATVELALEEISAIKEGLAKLNHSYHLYKFFQSLEVEAKK